MGAGGAEAAASAPQQTTHPKTEPRRAQLTDQPAQPRAAPEEAAEPAAAAAAQAADAGEAQQALANGPAPRATKRVSLRKLKKARKLAKAKAKETWKERARRQQWDEVKATLEVYRHSEDKEFVEKECTTTCRLRTWRLLRR